MTISDLHYRDFITVEFGSDVGMGFVQSVDERHKTVVFSKFDVLVTRNRPAKFKGRIENLILSFSEKRFNSATPRQYFNLCHRWDISPSFTIDDFLGNGDLIYTGICLRDGIDPDKSWMLIGFVNRIESYRHEFSRLIYHDIFLDDMMYYRENQELNGIEVRPYDGEFMEIRDGNRFTMRNETRLIHNVDRILEKMKNLETYREYTIQGMIP